MVRMVKGQKTSSHSSRDVSWERGEENALESVAGRHGDWGFAGESSGRCLETSGSS